MAISNSVGAIARHEVVVGAIVTPCEPTDRAGWFTTSSALFCFPFEQLHSVTDISIAEHYVQITPRCVGKIYGREEFAGRHVILSSSTDSLFVFVASLGSDKPRQPTPCIIKPRRFHYGYSNTLRTNGLCETEFAFRMEKLLYCSAGT